MLWMRVRGAITQRDQASVNGAHKTRYFRLILLNNYKVFQVEI